jgi:hypothetical protein
MQAPPPQQAGGPPPLAPGPPPQQQPGGAQQPGGVKMSAMDQLLQYKQQLETDLVRVESQVRILSEPEQRTAPLHLLIWADLG